MLSRCCILLSWGCWPPGAALQTWVGVMLGGGVIVGASVVLFVAGAGLSFTTARVCQPHGGRLPSLL